MNVWLSAAYLAHDMLRSKRGLNEPPHVLTLDQLGQVIAFNSRHKDYASSVASAGFVCIFDEETSIEVLATALRSAESRLVLERSK
ncbi:hypothetical protein [Lysobacter sp. CA196]|uniref:hypothetical protein n=1 Tax=Lysobacter sp. CA196 TaxID=3455606 RepID=UPI003F8D3288